MEGPQDLLQACFDQKTILMTPHVWLQHMQSFEDRIFTYFLCWVHWFGEHLQPPGGMVVTTNMDLMETQFSRNLGTRMIAQVWKRKAWYFKAKRLESALFGVLISFGVTHLREEASVPRSQEEWIDPLTRLGTWRADLNERVRLWLNVSFWIKFVYDKYQTIYKWYIDLYT